MIKKFILLFLVFGVLFCGCLDFGDDEETNAPTKAQVDACRGRMYLLSSAKIDPLGYKLLGSGIDDAIWFKFRTDASELSKLFDSDVVDTSGFEEGFELREIEKLKWWDVEGKKFFGGEVSLPNVKFMEVGVVKEAEGYLVYVSWYEV
jgi:hypothetical protein